MNKIIDKIYIGKVKDVPFAEGFNYSILGLCKYPLHQQNARLKGADKDGYLKISKSEPEYYFAERDHALYCNLIDADDVQYIPDIIIERALKFIADEIDGGRTVVAVCNNGISRSPSIALMYLIREGYFDGYYTFDEFLFAFERGYPMYSPNIGMYDYTKRFFESYIEKL